MNSLDIYYEELCDLIYQITINDNGWQKFARRLIEIMDVNYVHIQAIDFTFNMISYSNGIGILPKEAYAMAELDYLRFPTEDDPRWGQFLDPNRQGWYQCHSHITEEFVAKSDLYQKILLPVDLRFVATKELIWDDKICVFLTITTSVKRKALNKTELEFLDRLIIHLKRVVISLKKLFEFSSDSIVGFELVDQLPQPIVIINLSGQEVHHNQAAASLFDQHPVLKLKDHRLQLGDAEQQRFLAVLYKIERDFRYQKEAIELYKNMDFKIADTDLLLKMNLLLSEKEILFWGTRPLVLVSIEQEKPDVSMQNMKNQVIYQLSQDQLIKRFKLTKRELQLCEFFVNGLNLEQIADQMNLTRSSVRTYLRNIFEKTLCNSQVELMHLLMRFVRK